jgi:general stress protein 26
MAPSVDEDLGHFVWFVTARGTDLETATRNSVTPARFVAADSSAGLYADVEGTLAQVKDQETLDKVWSVFAAAWFEGGKDDPDVCLLRFAPSEAEVSVTAQNGAKFLYEIAKGNLTSEKPDVGAQGTISF